MPSEPKLVKPPKFNRPGYAADYVKHETSRASYFGNPVIDNMMTALVAVTAEVWSNRRRMKTIEALLEEKGITEEMIEAYVPSKEREKKWGDERDAFVQRTMSVLAREADFAMSDDWEHQEFPDKGFSKGGVSQ